MKYKFVKFASIYDDSITLYALEEDRVEKTIDDTKFIEVTPDFERAMMVRLDSLKPIGTITKEF